MYVTGSRFHDPTLVAHVDAEFGLGNGVASHMASRSFIKDKPPSAMNTVVWRTECSKIVSE